MVKKGKKKQQKIVPCAYAKQAHTFETITMKRNETKEKKLKKKKNPLKWSAVYFPKVESFFFRV